jgi:predicted nucleic acid-binding protein
VNALVLDASAALALLIDPASRVRSGIREALGQAIVDRRRILVAPTFWTDVLAGLSGRPGITLVEAVYELEQLGLETAGLGRPAVLAVIDAMGRGAGPRDAAALVLAEASDARLLTASPRLAAIAGERAILVGRRRAASRQRIDRSWTRWRGAADYLRQLRSAL